MTYKPETFKPIARAIGWLLSGSVPGLYRWGDYNRDENLVDYRTGDPDRLLFQRYHNDKAWIELSNIRPFELVDLKYHEPTVLRTRQIDASSITVENYIGIELQPYKYEVEFADTVDEKEAVSAGATVSSKTTFGTGDGLPVKGEQEFSLAVTSGWEKTVGKKAMVNRTFTHSGEVQPGNDIRVFATREISDMRRHITGFGTFECAIRIGKRYRPKGRSSQIWRGAKYWSSIADLIAVVEGRSPLDWDLAYHFEHNPPPRDRIDLLNKYPRAPYEQWIDYQDVTNIQLTQEVIRVRETSPPEEPEDDDE